MEEEKKEGGENLGGDGGNDAEKEMEEKNETMGESKKNKNLWSLIILLAGLFAGSLFVDAAQFVRGSGYSQKNLNRSEIFSTKDKTWVAYNEPIVGVQVISDDACEECDPSEALVWLKRVLPTISTQKVSYDSEEGKKIIEEFEIRTLPAFVFDKGTDQTELYAQAKEIFEPKKEAYVMNTQMLGMPAGKYLSVPEVGEGDAVFGAKDAKVKVVIFSDFQCPYCKVFHTALRDIMKTYEDKVLFGFNQLPLEELHPQATNAALASECALEQSKFWEYADELYAKQAEWGNAKDNSRFKEYARRLGLNTGQFNECLDTMKFAEKVTEDKASAQSYGISGTPTVFINDQVKSGALTAEQLKADIDAQLAE
jgi:protein-disulfide isomerase